METHAFASLAHVRVLLVPVGTISRTTFETFTADIRTFDCIRLGDIPADTKDHRARFMPNPLSAGHLHLTFPSHPPPTSHLPLSLLRPSHFPLAVIGVAACAQTDSLGTILAQFNAYLSELFPAGGIFPLAKNCFVFEESDGSTNLNLGDNLPGLVVIPSMMGNKKLYIGTLLADLCSHVLGEFGVMVQTLESPLGNEYLNSSLMPVLPPLSDIPMPLDGRLDRDALPYLPSHNSQPDMTKTGLSVASPPSMKRNSSSGPTFRQQTLNVQPPKKRVSGVGVTSSHGRLYKVLGDLFLLAGRTEDALIWYTEAIQLLKSSSDLTWYAATLEGVATIFILEAWAAGHGLHNSTGGTVEPWAEVSERLIQATALYSKSPAVDGEQNYSLLAYLYSCCVLRHASLLFSIWSAKGWGPLAFTTMLQPGSTPYLPPTLSADNSDGVVRERLSSISGVSRSSISAILSQIHGPWLLHLGAGERIAILEATASLFGCLGYQRKEAYILREVLGCILDLIVCGREEDGLSKISGTPPIPGTETGASSHLEKGTLGVRLNESAEGNEGILKLLKYVCRVFGINLDAVSLFDEASVDSPAERGGDSADFQEPSGWPELQIGVIREAVAVAEALPDFLSVAQFSLSALKTLQSILTPGDQHHLHLTSGRALTTARRRGDAKLVDYWSGTPVVSIAIAPLPLVRLPIETPISALHPSASDVTPILTGGTDPFLYNPRKGLATHGKSLVVQNETLEFLITLQNPYIFDLELQGLSLSTSGVPFEAKPIRVLIPANSFHEVSFSGKAPETGTLVIRGCIARALGSIACEFLLPLGNEEEEENSARRRSAFACEVGRSKYHGLASYPWATARQRTSLQKKPTTTQQTARFLECKVVPEQPLLRIRRTSVTHGALMLYDGEVSTIRITLENVSLLPVDFLRLVFDDSTLVPAQQRLSEGDLSVFETYETEYDLIHRPAFSWNKIEAKDVAPGQKVTLVINCFGKVGCTNGTVHISYSYSRRSQLSLNAPPDVFHIRQLSCPLMVTVYQMLECHTMDILPLPTNTSWEGDETSQELGLRRDNLRVDDKSSWCLFSVEVRNTYGSPFEVMFERHQEGTPLATTSTTVPPGSMSRILLPLKKFRLSEGHLEKPIPTLSDRQFVVAKSKLSEAESQIQRALFWYREELFNCIRGSWREAGGSRSGALSLRSQRMTMIMLETLQLEAVRVQLSLKPHPNHPPVVRKGEKFYLEPNDFVHLTIEVQNQTPASALLTLDIGIESSEHVVLEGAQSGLAIGRLAVGESCTQEVGVCFLARGHFEIFAEVVEHDTLRGDRRAGFGHLIAVVRENVGGSRAEPTTAQTS